MCKVEDWNILEVLGHITDGELVELLEAYAAQRRAMIATLRSFDAEARLRRGTVSGHELHHLADFYERYGI